MRKSLDNITSIDWCVKRAAELHMSYGEYVSSPQYRKDKQQAEIAELKRLTKKRKEKKDETT